MTHYDALEQALSAGVDYMAIGRPATQSVQIRRKTLKRY